jgi:hypothetical protein
MRSNKAILIHTTIQVIKKVAKMTKEHQKHAWFPYMKIAQFFFLGQNGSMSPPIPRRRMLTSSTPARLAATRTDFARSPARHCLPAQPAAIRRLAAARPPSVARRPAASRCSTAFVRRQKRREEEADERVTG